ncbi:PaaI family thioesterase [Deinococcus sp. SL84]|uniref:PaaI family thioesterase n=1 Tax=Deinococcus sp. SL84 TaxID=2994663 RepID=UPI002273219E|nr:PaaI family thioesterase [Deinococcus sp. SL84]MCY1702637.1 PaaI family thioesterase [Deinococcus sp. SL84]
MTLPADPQQLLTFADSILAQQSFSALIGARFTAIGEGRATLQVPLREDLRQHHGFAHGGLLASMADITLTFVGALHLGPQVLTSEFKINFIRPAVGETLVARGELVGGTARQAVTRCDIYAVRHGEDGQPGEKLVATAQGTIVLPDTAAPGRAGQP